MIIEKKVQHEIIEDDFLTIISQVNQKKLAKLYGLLSNIYRNPIGAIVREYASNAYDANVEARNFGTLSYEEIRKMYSWVDQPEFNMDESAFNKLKASLTRVSETEPVIVGIAEQDNQPYFYIKDYGIGLSHERMVNIYFNYLDSTKEDTDEEIGGFGIGSKSALSYTHTFYIDTVYQGIAYKYIMSKSETGIPQGQLLYKSDYDPTLENGTTIRINFRDTEDIVTFYDECYKQLSYMDNLFFDNSYFVNNNYPGISYDKRNKVDTINDYTLYRGYGWMKKSVNEPYKEMHLCLGKVAYTIDWTELEMSSLNVPIALTFNVGELEPTPSRESIVYTKHAVNIIKEKILKVQEIFRAEYKKKYTTTNDLKVYMDLRRNQSSKVNLGPVEVELTDMFGHVEGEKLKTGSLIKFQPFEDAGFKYIPPNHFFFQGYDMRKKILSKSARCTVQKYSTSIHFDNHVLRNNNFIFDGKRGSDFTFHDNAYFLEEGIKNTNNDIWIIETRKKYNYDSVLNLYNYSTQEEQDKITEVFVREIEKFLSENGKDYYKYYPNPNWFHRYDAGKSYYSADKKKKLEGKIFTYEADTWGGNFRQKELELQDIASFNGIVLYDEHENKIDLQKYLMLLRQCDTIIDHKAGYSYPKVKALMCISVSKANYKILEEMENTMTPEQAIKGVRTFKRIVTAMFIKERFKKLSNLSKINGCNEELDLKYNLLEKYINNNFQSERFLNEVEIDDDFKNGLMMIAKNRNMIDTSIVSDLEWLEEYNKDLELLKAISRSNISNATIPYLVDYLKLKGKRVSNSFYLKI